MSSSTSSSKRRFLARVAAIGLVLFAGFEASLRLHLLPEGIPRGDYQTNIQKAEKYVFDAEGGEPCVVVGSSLSDNVAFRLDRCLDLSFPFASAQSGLLLIQRAHRPPPKAVLVEVNDPESMGVNQDIVGLVANPVTAFAVGHVYAFRETYQPVSILRRLTSRGKTEAPNGGPVESARQARFASQAKPYTPEALAGIRGSLTLLRSQVDDLAARGIPIYLYRLPEDAQADGLARQVQFRDLAQSVLPPDRYRWIDVDVPGQVWKSNDGIHLAPASRDVFAKALIEQLNRRGIPVCYKP